MRLEDTPSKFEASRVNWYLDTTELEKSILLIEKAVFEKKQLTQEELMSILCDVNNIWSSIEEYKKICPKPVRPEEKS